MTFFPRPCSTILPVTVALEASPPVRIFWSSVCTLKIEPNFTCSPTSPDTLSTRMVSPGATRYCFPPDLITAYITPPDLETNHNYTGIEAGPSTLGFQRLAELPLGHNSCVPYIQAAKPFWIMIGRGVLSRNAAKRPSPPN